MAPSTDEGSGAGIEGRTQRMTAGPIRVGIRKVLSSGTVIAPRSEPIIISPFPNNAKFECRFEYKFDDIYQAAKVEYAPHQAGALIILTAKYAGGKPIFSSQPTPFAVDERNSYVIYFILEFFGYDVTDIVKFTYTICQEPKR